MSRSGGKIGGGAVTFPLTSAGDQEFQPGGVASNTLTLHNPASAVNGITLNGSATGATPALAATGTDANIGLELDTKGTGALIINGAAGTAGQFLQSNGAGAAPTWGTAAGVSWPLTNAGDETFQPNGVASNTLTLHNPASAVNGVKLIGAATGGAPTIAAVGSDANIGLNVSNTGAENIILQAGSYTWTFTGVTGSTGGTLTLPGGSIKYQNPGITFTTSSNMRFEPEGLPTSALILDSAASAVNGVSITAQAHTQHPLIQASGSDANAGISIAGAGSGNVVLTSPNCPSLTNDGGILLATAPAFSVNGVTVSASATGIAPSIVAFGTDTNIDLTVGSKGTGVINFGYATTAISGTVNPATLAATTGGATGPATAAQNSWLAVKVNGTTSFLPVWR